MGNNRQRLIVYIVLVLTTLAAFWRVYQFDFVLLNDYLYVAKNHFVTSGLSFEVIRWAFSTTDADFWHPLVWLSFMLDYQLYGLNAGGYHMTNLILHILSTLLLFWLFCRMTGALWKSAFVAALFAIHPLHVQSVAWVSERKDVLSAFFWMLTLCLYVYYTEKPAVKRYLLVLASFVLALMSKPMVVTLPLIMILLDYWPLKRFESRKDNLFLWQVKEKMPLFVLSAVFSIINVFAQYKNITNIQHPLSSLYTNSLFSFVTYLEKTFWPYNLSVYYDFFYQMPLWQIVIYGLLIIFISFAAIVYAKRLPFLFVGWLWYVITLMPVIGIIPRGFNNMADHYTYLPLTGIFIIIAWVTPELIKNQRIKRSFLMPAAILSIAIAAILSWHQAGYWRNSVDLFSHAVKVTKNCFLAHDGLGNALAEQGKLTEAIEHYNIAIHIHPYYRTYDVRGAAYGNMKKFEKALDDFNMAIHLRPDYARAFNNRAIVYGELGRYDLAVEDISRAILLDPDYRDAYYDRGYFYYKIGKYQLAIDDYNKAKNLHNHNIFTE